MVATLATPVGAPSTVAGMGKIPDRLADRGHVLPPPLTPPPAVVLPFQMVRIVGDRAVASGHGPQLPDGSVGGPLGRVGDELTVEEAYEAAMLVGLSILGDLERALGDLDRITAWCRLFGVVWCPPDFHQQPAVINGCSDLILEVFGPEVGAHIAARSAWPASRSASRSRSKPRSASGRDDQPVISAPGQGRRGPRAPAR